MRRPSRMNSLHRHFAGMCQIASAAVVMMSVFTSPAQAASGDEADMPALSASIDRANTEARLSVGDLDIRLYADSDRHGDADWPVPVVTIEKQRRQVAELVPEAGGANYPATVSVVEFTIANDNPEVVLESYSGGAHCCVDVLAAFAEDTNWRVLSLGMFDGGGGLIRDADGDGLFELVTPDNAFLYAFGCYACTTAPLRVLTIRGGRVVDLSAEDRFVPIHRAHLARLEARAQSHGDFASNGFLAGWVASKIRIGEGADAWRRMLDVYDREDDWGLESCRTGEKLHECETADIVVRPFPVVLREFLIAGGYDF